MSRPAASSAAIDLAKVVAAHLILFHHFVIYGPLPAHTADDGAATLLDSLLAALASAGRLAVQVVRVLGGYLGAGSMLARLERAGDTAPPRQAWALIVARAQRLLPTYWLAAALMLGVAAWLRWGLADTGAPVPALAQVAANLLLLQDVLGFEGLSAGFWYVAIDLQLYVGLVLLAALCGRLASAPAQSSALFGSLTVGLVLASLLGWNLQAGLDAWAPYFAGAYGLGMLACLLTRVPSRSRAPVSAWERPAGLRLRAGCSTTESALFVGVMGLLALVLAWRSRIAVATLTAVALCALPQIDAVLGRLPARLLALLRTLSGASYPIFLLHYPLMLGVCGTAAALTDVPALKTAALLACWPLSLWAGIAAQRRLDDPSAAQPVQGAPAAQFQRVA